MIIDSYVELLQGDIDYATCPFTDEEVAELDETEELLVYLPRGYSLKDLVDLFGFPCNVDFDAESNIHTVMNDEDQWFITGDSESPELLYESGKKARRIQEDESLYGMDFRRYVAFAATYRNVHGELPDDTYWTFLLSGSYDRSGVSIVGFDGDGVLNHHGWMENFKAKFVGSRYVALPPRVEINDETRRLQRSYRGDDKVSGREASTD